MKCGLPSFFMAMALFAAPRLVAAETLLGVATRDVDDSVEERSYWSDGSARTMPAGRTEVGVLSPARYAPVDGVELGLHPLWFFVLPHVEAKLAWASYEDGWYLATQHRLSYPTLFLNAVATEGAGALLPADSEVPQALVVDNYVLSTRKLGPDQVLTLRGGVSVAPRTESSLPLLDFPFLYSRFAPLYAPFVPRAGALIEGRIVGSLYYALDFLASYLPVGDEEQGTRDAWAFEEALELHYRYEQTHQFSIGMRVEQAEYAIGWRTHLLPTIDYRCAW